MSKPMPLREIIDQPTVLSPDHVEKIFGLEPGLIKYHSTCKGIHESVLRAYQELQLVKDLLAKRVDPEVILDLLELLEELSFEKNPHGNVLP